MEFYNIVNWFAEVKLLQYLSLENKEGREDICPTNLSLKHGFIVDPPSSRLNDDAVYAMLSMLIEFIICKSVIVFTLLNCLIFLLLQKLWLRGTSIGQKYGLEEKCLFFLGDYLMLCLKVWLRGKMFIFPWGLSLVMYSLFLLGF